MRILFSLFLILGACQTIKPTREFSVQNKRTVYLPLKTQFKSRIPSTSKPLYTPDKVVAANAYDGIQAFSRNNMERIWYKKIEGGVESGLVYKGSRLYFGGNDFHFYAVNIASGVEVWREKVEGEILSEPLLVNDRIYFLTSANALYCLNAKDGKQIWRYKRNIEQEFTVRGASSPVIEENRLYIGFSDGYFASLRTKDGSIVWERPINTNLKFKDIDANAKIDGKRIFISGFDNKLYSLSKKDGQIEWTLDKGGVYAPVIQDDNLIYATTTGELLVIEKSSGKIVKSWQTNGVFRKPFLKDNYLIVGSSNGPIRFIDTINWKELARYHSGMGVSSQVVSPEKGMISFVSEGSNLIELSYEWRRRGL